MILKTTTKYTRHIHEVPVDVNLVKLTSEICYLCDNLTFS